MVFVYFGNAIWQLFSERILPPHLLEDEFVYIDEDGARRVYE